MRRAATGDPPENEGCQSASAVDEAERKEESPVGAVVTAPKERNGI
jgi:hypothetical protein